MHSNLDNFRIVHIGNIANNAYMNTKLLRQCGIEVDAVNCDYHHVMSQPEWEDADLAGEVDEFSPDWNGVDLRGFRRPEWFYDIDLKKIDINGMPLKGLGRLRYWLDHEKTHVAQMLERIGMHRNPGEKWTWPQTHEGRMRAGVLLPIAALLYSLARVNDVFERGRSDYYRWSHDQRVYIDNMLASHAIDKNDLNWALPRACKLQKILSSYDLVQAYGVEPIYAMLLSAGTPYIAFEHGTLRDLPFEESPTGRLLKSAYLNAAKVIVTNPDVIRSANRIGLDNIVFIPHPIDEDRVISGENEIDTELRERYPGAFICMAPARQNWKLKGNDRAIRAFASFAADKRNAILLLAGWGQEVARSKALIKDLGIGDLIVWYKPVHKHLLRKYYQAVDVVLDQFELGSFGGITPEAMAAGKPVLVYYDRQVQEWCFPEAPPLLNVRTECEITSALVRLYDDSACMRDIGHKAKLWVKKHHGRKRVIDSHIAIYEEVLHDRIRPVS